MLILTVIKLFIFLSALRAITHSSRKRSTALYCGIFAFCGDPKLIDRNLMRCIMTKFKILGLYNESRGKHSCGVFMANEITKGVDEKKLFSDFIQKTHFFDPLETGNFVMIGHARQATHGTHTEANAHPFLVENDLVLAHNGVIKNVWSLCSKYKQSHTNIQVDSLALATLIHKHGFKILNEYEGAAALLMTRLSEPNSIYFYKGSS